MSTVITPFQGTDPFSTATFNNRISQINTGFSYVSNPNLLDNWYFGNPVDQRQGRVVVPNTTYYSDNTLTTSAGTTSAYVTAYRYATGTANGVNYASFKLEDKDTSPTYYAAPENVVRGYIPRWNEYAMDRWAVEVNAVGELIILIEDDGIVLKNVTEKHLQFKQILPEDIQINGNTCNISVLVNQVESGSVGVALSQVSSPWSDSIATETITTGGMYSATGICLQQQQKIIVYVFPNTTVIIKAIKLELGSTQTLAHQGADGNWVLNEIPDYGEQLRRCQRYFVNFNPYKMPYFTMPPAVASNAYQAYSAVTLPVAMRAQPVVAYRGNIVLSQDANHAVTSISVSDNTFTGNSIQLKYEEETGSLTANSLYRVQGGYDASAYIWLSADL